jgi:asparagine synthase (glutamine-hydrolysing)
VIATLAQRATSQPLETFAIGFEEEGFSELPYARQVARRLGTRHVEQIVRPDAVGLLEKFSAFWDEPFADASAIPTFLVSDGGDEAFGGYLRYAHDLREGRLRGLLPAWLRRPLLGHLAQAWPKADWLPRPLRAKTLLTNLALEAGPAYANTLSICRSPLRRQLLHADVKAQLNGHRPERCIEQGHATAPAADGLELEGPSRTDKVAVAAGVPTGASAGAAGKAQTWFRHADRHVAARPTESHVRGNRVRQLGSSGFACRPASSPQTAERPSGRSG